MAFLVSPSSSSSSSSSRSVSTSHLLRRRNPSAVFRRRIVAFAASASQSSSCSETLTHSPIVSVAEAFSEDQLWAASCLRVRSFYNFDPNLFNLQDHRKYLAEREFEALKDRVAGKRKEFRRVSCINATLPLSQITNVSEDFCAECKDGEERVVVGSLDLNQGISLPDEIAGTRPVGIGADFARAYLSNVCVASELHRKGLGYAIIAKSKLVAQDWGVSDLYVHVAIDNEPAKRLYLKSGFVHESEEQAWQARFLDRPRRILLWTSLPINYEL